MKICPSESPANERLLVRSFRDEGEIGIRLVPGHRQFVRDVDLAVGRTVNQVGAERSAARLHIHTVLVEVRTHPASWMM